MVVPLVTVIRVIRIPESPRVRRRLTWGALAVGLLAAGLAIAIFVPGKSPSNATPTGNALPAQLAVNTHQKLSAADRAKIDTLLDRFFPAAVERRDPQTAWALAGPEMRSSSSLRDFRNGASPVPSYPANEPNYHHWRAIDVEKDFVVLNILVHPKNPKKLGTWVFSVEVVKAKSRWLVNRIYTIAVMNPPVRPATVTHELGPADYARSAAHLANIRHEEPLEPLVPPAGDRDLSPSCSSFRWRLAASRCCGRAAGSAPSGRAAAPSFHLFPRPIEAGRKSSRNSRRSPNFFAATVVYT